MKSSDATEEKINWWVEPITSAKRKKSTISWYVVGLIMATLGISIQFILAFFNKGFSVDMALNSTLHSGSYYLVIVSLLVSSTVQMNWERKKSSDAISEIKGVMASAGFIILLFAALFVAFEVTNPTNSDGPNGQFQWQHRDILQMIMFVIGILIAAYSFLLLLYEEDLDQFAEDTNKIKTDLSKNSDEAKSDDRGMRL